MLSTEEVLAVMKQTPATTSAMRALRKRISRELREADRGAVLRIAFDLISHPPFGRYLACELVREHAPTMSRITRAEVERLGAGMTSWGDVDVFACYIAGPAWRAGRIRDALIEKWAASPEWCSRRAALVSTVPLNAAAHGGDGDTPRTLAICGLLISDRHDLVVKAMSWALRVLSKQDAESVCAFLFEHRGDLAARVIREVNNKLRTGLKNPHFPSPT